MNEVERLPALIQRAVRTLESAKSASEILDAKDAASVAYVAGKTAARLAKIRDAHSTVMQTAHRVMGSAIELEMRALARLASAYDDAVTRGEVHGRGKAKKSRLLDGKKPPTAAEIGLDSARIFEARAVAAAEKAQPGCVHQAIEERLQAAKIPTKEHVKRVISAISRSKISNRHTRKHVDRRGPEVEAALPTAIDDIERCRDLVDRVRSRHASSPDICAVCEIASRWIAEHHVEAKEAVAPDNGERVAA
jgi:hypothetical protein